MVAVIAGVATLSLAGGIAGYLVVSTIGGFFWLPFGAAVLSHIYRVRAGPPGMALDAVGAAAEGPVSDAAAAGPGSGDTPPSA